MLMLLNMHNPSYSDQSWGSTYSDKLLLCSLQGATVQYLVLNENSLKAQGKPWQHNPGFGVKYTSKWSMHTSTSALNILQKALPCPILLTCSEDTATSFCKLFHVDFQQNLQHRIVCSAPVRDSNLTYILWPSCPHGSFWPCAFSHQDFIEFVASSGCSAIILKD